MEFLANENFPAPSIGLIRDAGYQVYSISESSPGESDEQVISKAKKEGLIILTFDKDYGEILMRTQMPDPPSVVFFRYKGQNPTFAGNILIELLTEPSIELVRKFTVIDKGEVRQRTY
jgi:predicted nuclease of predicted toxin-antitoxin system